MHKGKCPQCGKSVKHTKIEALPIHDHSRARWQGVAFLCPHCETILGTGIDPEALIVQLMIELKKKEDTIKYHI
jgi:predicted RNA-binding Zn-ribbon protein involved in translation (DUF1610 family)